MSIQELLNYWEIVKKHLWLIGLLAGVTVGTVLLLSYLAKPLYRATTSFQVTTPLPTDVTLVSEYKTSTTRDELVYTRNNFLSVLQNEFIVGQVITKLGLDTSPAKLLSQIVVEPDPNSDFVKLSVIAPDPQTAADIANAMVGAATQSFGELSATSFTADKKVILQLQVQRKQELDAARSDLIQFQIDNKVGAPDGILSSQDKLITASKTNRDQALAEGKLDVAANYDKIVAARERELQELVRLNAEYQNLDLNVKRIQSNYYDLLDKETEAELKESEVLNARFIQAIPARTPSNPLPSLDVRVLLLSGVTSLVVGIVLAFGIEYIETNRKAGVMGEAKVAPAHKTSWESEGELSRVIETSKV